MILRLAVLGFEEANPAAMGASPQTPTVGDDGVP